MFNTDKPILVTREEFTKWILDQDDSRPVNMQEIRGTDPCGCVMVQYAKEVLSLPPETILCGWSVFTSPFDPSIVNRPQLVKTDILQIFGIFHLSRMNNFSDFGDLKRHLKDT